MNTVSAARVERNVAALLGRQRRRSVQRVLVRLPLWGSGALPMRVGVRIRVTRSMYASRRTSRILWSRLGWTRASPSIDPEVVVACRRSLDLTSRPSHGITQFWQRGLHGGGAQLVQEWAPRRLGSGQGEERDGQRRVAAVGRREGEVGLGRRSHQYAAVRGVCALGGRGQGSRVESLRCLHWRSRATAGFQRVHVDAATRRHAFGVGFTL
jgi:hypothetical protein